RLVRDLKNQNPQTRKKAAEDLGRLAPRVKEAIPALIEACGEDDSIVWGAATKELIRLKEEAVLQMATAIRQSQNTKIRWSMMETLKKMGPAAKDAVPALAEVLKEPADTVDDILCFTAASALVAIDPDHTGIVPVLIQGLEHSPGIR